MLDCPASLARTLLGACALGLVTACHHLPERGGDRATILIGQPTVFTRERSLVERFEDLEWLRDQRGPTKAEEYEQGVQGSVKTVTGRSTALGLKLSLGAALAQAIVEAEPTPAEPEPSTPTGEEDGVAPKEGDGAAGADGDGGTQDGQTPEGETPEGETPEGETPNGAPPGASNPSAAVDMGALATAYQALEGLGSRELDALFDGLTDATPSVSPRDLLVDRLAFRDAAAEAIRERTLDDTHDLEGMALYELQFDLTLVAGADAGRAYAVVLEVEDDGAIDGCAPGSCAGDHGAPGALARRVTDVVYARCLAAIDETATVMREGRVDVREAAVAAEAWLLGRLLARQTLAAHAFDAVQAHLAPSERTRGAAYAVALNYAVVALKCFVTSSTPTGALDPNGKGFRDEFLAAVLADDSDRVLSAALINVDAFATTVAKLLRVHANRFKPVDDPVASPSPDELVDFWGSLSFDPVPSKLPVAALDPRDPDALRRVARALEEPTEREVAPFAERVGEYLTARRFAGASGAVLSFDPQFARADEGARGLLPLLVKRSEPAAQCWVERNASRPARAVAVSPTEAAERLATSAASDLSSALSIVADGLFRGTITAGDAAFERVEREIRRQELIARNPLLVGFVGGESHGGATPEANRFGWLIGPRLETATKGDAELRYRHLAVHHPVTATIVAPAALDELTLRYRVFEVRDSGHWDEVRPSTGPLGPRTATPEAQRLTVRLPVDAKVVAAGLLAIEQWDASEPRIATARARIGDERSEATGERGARWHLEAGASDQSLVIVGAELWRNPQVFVGGQRADRVRILPDLGGLWAEFDRVRLPAGAGSGSARADLIVSTSRGTDRVLDGVEIHPPKKQRAPAPSAVTPASQVVVARKTAGTKRTIDLAFTLDPPLPKRWDELRVRIRRAGALGDLALLRRGPKDVLRGDGAGAIRLRDLVVDRGAPWAAVERLEVTLALSSAADGLLGDLHAEPVEVVVVAESLGVQADGAVDVTLDQTKTRWVTTGVTKVRLERDEPLPAAVLAALTKGTQPKEAAVAVEGVNLPGKGAELEPVDGAAGRAWTLTLPKDFALRPVSGSKPPGAAPLTVSLGMLRLQATLQTKKK